MFCTKLIRQLKLPKIRHLSTPASGSKPTSNNPIPKPSAPESSDHSVIGSPMHTCSNFDKRILVWVKRYPSIDKVPDQVTADCILKAHSKGRIRACNIMIVFTVVVFIVTIMLGKKDAAAGKHIIPERIKWYNEQREKGRAEEAAAAAAAAAAAGKS
ncbi:UPF0389 protein CG9231 [Andrena cerasifolii]|uniref:UPF0389 protein CG9231 n=1 Tax=Andrena cerasifolii TaxID=2819439 RepID=UPI004037B3DB